MKRHELTDQQWELLTPFFPPRPRKRGGQWKDDRTILNGIFWRLNTGAPWRDLPERYGFNDVPPLKLRRWRRHVDLHDGCPDTLFLPMLVRGDVLGFIACGAKVDRTAFLDDEIAPLAQLAHHIGLAHATLAPARKLQSI